MPVGSQTHRPVAQLKAVTNPTIENLVSPINVLEEFTYSFPSSSKKVLFRCRDGLEVRFSFTSIDTSSKWVTLPGGASFSDWGLDLSGIILYLKVNGVSANVEILTWT